MKLTKIETKGEIGSGNQNTINIMNGCTESGIAARLCGDLVQGGFSDWFLPSKDELNLLYVNRALTGMGTDIYWSSTEGDNGNAWIQNFTFGFQSYVAKVSTYNVRAVRAF